MSNIFGEPVIPILYSTMAGQINYSRAGRKNKVDQWHFDSCTYVAVIILSDIEDMIGCSY